MQLLEVYIAVSVSFVLHLLNDSGLKKVLSSFVN